MLKKRIQTILFSLLILIGLGQASLIAREPNASDRKIEEATNKLTKPPVIIIPGILGSQLINEKTGEKVWFRISRSEDDDLRLPISLDLKRSRDNLLPGDIIRSIDIRLLPDIEIYQEVVDSLKERAGYEEASWDKPPRDLNGKFFVYPYDWRRDNVETARNLINKIDRLRAKSKTPRAKFHVLAHSMGGLVARYAAMYGRADLPKGKPRPTWIGERYFSKIFFFGTPNEGSVEAFQTILEGRSSLGGVTNLPFVRDLSPLDIATMPSVFQLFPHQNTLRAFDENLQPLKVDIYNIESWQKYKWAVFDDEKKYLEEFSLAERGRFEEYFSIALQRAEKFHEALNANARRKIALDFYAIGSDCSDTLDALILYKSNGKWVTLAKPASFRTSTGKKVSSDAVKKLIMVPGDGKVTKTSLLGETAASTRKNKKNRVSTVLPIRSKSFACERHDSLMGNLGILVGVFESLTAKK